MTKEMKFVVCDYFATGEGRTVCILVTYIQPRLDDYEVRPSYEYNRDGKLQLNPGTLKISENDILYRDFKEIFGGYLAIGAEYLDKDAFVNRFGVLYLSLLSRVSMNQWVTFVTLLKSTTI